MRQIVIKENDIYDVMDYLISESFVPASEQTLLVKEYLDNNFTRQYIDDIDTNGYPIKTPVAALMMGKQIGKRLQMRELLLLLVDKFQNMIKNEHDLKQFLKQVIQDWFEKKISREGVLSVNHV